MATYDQNGNVIDLAKPDGTAVIDGKTQQVYADLPEITVNVPKAVDLSDWLKPPKLWYTLAGLALVGYLWHNKKGR